MFIELLVNFSLWSNTISNYNRWRRRRWRNNTSSSEGTSGVLQAFQELLQVQAVVEEVGVSMRRTMSTRSIRWIRWRF
jgi:hypothetical protein